jgi:stage III sporulation protein AE
VTQDETLQKLSKWMIQVSSKGLRIILYVFTGYLTITGVISGAADQMAIKAAKLTISSMIPVVGNIMADASETILVSAGIAKGAIGIYGLWTMIALGISPMLSIGAQYLSLKATGAACSLFSGKAVSNSTEAFASAMGLLLAMTGTMCLLIMISTVCFMKGLSG